LKTAYAIIILSLLTLAACAPAGTIPEPPPSPTPGAAAASTATPAATSTPQKVVEVSLSDTSGSSARVEVPAGDTAHLRLSLEPALLTISPGMVSEQRWEDAALKELRVCFALDAACSLDSLPWAPYQAVTETSYPVDWLGPRPVWVALEVRDADGNTVPAYVRYSNAVTAQAQASLEITGVVDASLPPEKQPVFVQTAIAATQAAFPLSGSVKIQGSPCCVGGVAGSTVNAHVEFAAQGANTRVTEMRVSQGSCDKGAASLDAPWEPFAASKDYKVGVIINWTTFTIAVQYRDAAGNLSPVYCDSIGVEGSPEQSTP